MFHTLILPMDYQPKTILKRSFHSFLHATYIFVVLKNLITYISLIFNLIESSRTLLMRPNVVHDLNHKYAEYHMYQFILLHSCDYLQKISIKINVATDKGNRRVEL